MTGMIKVCITVLDIKIDIKNPDEGVFRILEDLEPKWKTDDVAIKVRLIIITLLFHSFDVFYSLTHIYTFVKFPLQTLVGGYVNSMHLVTHASDENHDHGYVFRIFEDKREGMMDGTRRREVVGMSLAAQQVD